MIRSESFNRRLSKKHHVLINKFIAERDYITLEALDDALSDAKRKAKQYKDKRSKRRAADGIDIGVLNECLRVPEAQRSALEKLIVNSHDIVEQQTRNSEIDQQLEASIEKHDACVREWQAIRDAFVDLYPDAVSAPRSPRSQLESSDAIATPKYTKSKSTTSLLLRSPRRFLSNSGKIRLQKRNI